MTVPVEPAARTAIGPAAREVTEPAARTAIELVARTSYGRLVAYLASGSGDLAGAQDALADAFLAALRTWPARGIPARPDSWLLTAARRNLVNAARRRDVAARALPSVAQLLAEQAEQRPDDEVPDTRAPTWPRPRGPSRARSGWAGSGPTSCRRLSSRCTPAVR